MDNMLPTPNTLPANANQCLDKAAADKFRAALQAQNMTIADWAHDNDYPLYAVYRVLNRYEEGKRGRSKAIATAILATAA